MGTSALVIRRFLLFLSMVVHGIRALFAMDTHLHRARFANTSELSQLLTPTPPADGLLLGRASLRSFVTVRPQKTRREIGNLLIVGPTRSGKGLLATSQLLSWHQSVIVNDIKGELFSSTAGYRSTLGKVFVIDPTGIGHCFDPLQGKKTEDEFFSSAAQLLFKPDAHIPQKG